MALRNKFADQHAEYAPPYRGVNLRESSKDLQPGESPLMQNCIYDGGTRSRTGSTVMNSTSLGAFRIRGGIKFYRNDATAQRLIAYSTNIASLSDLGVAANITTGLTSDQDVFFTPWSITDACYVTNNSNTLGYVSNTGTFATVSGTNIPSPLMVTPLRDRLMAITTNGIERTNARVDTVWSSNSSWATLRPTLSGRFTALHPYSFETATGSTGITTSLLAFQANALYLVTGTNFGTDVTAASASTGEDSSISLRDHQIGTSSPYSITTVPGVGTFWFTTDLNVYWLPANAPTGRYVGDKLLSNSGILGLESLNLSALNQVWMTYFDRKLILGFPTGTNTYATRQYWMDLRSLIERPERGPVWYGPMTGQTIGRAWTEQQSGDNALRGGEGNSSTGAFVYSMLQNDKYTDDIGTTATAYTTVYQTYFKTMGRADFDKYIRAVHLDMNAFSGTTTVDVYDLTGQVVGSVSVAIDHLAKTCQPAKISYGNNVTTYNSGDAYADYDTAYAGFTAFVDRSCGEYISIRVNHSGSLARVDAIRLSANLRKREE